MLISTTGLVADHFYISGLASFPVHLLDCKMPVLFDGGVTCAGDLYINAIRSVLGVRQPEILFISHVHWDHCGAVSRLKEAFPELKVAASRTAAEILKRPRALGLMGKLNEEVKTVVAGFPDIDPSRLLGEPFHSFEVNIELADGQTIEVDDNLTVRVMETPGHTRDHLSYYIPEKKILLAAEASGCLSAAGTIVSEFLADYDAYFSSLTRLAGLQVDLLCQGHHVVFNGAEEVRGFLSRSVSETIRFRDRVCELLKLEGGLVDRVVERIKAEQYDVIEGVKQLEAAYLINLRARVSHLAEKENCL
jgi:glyoxylase-like metal-dependent hydrolase (beta-lactamase superfamily II)